MDNFELHELAQQLADTNSSYKLARVLVEVCEELIEFQNSEPFRDGDTDLHSLLEELLE